ncbi:MAG: hypothetical protein J7M19_03165 [Planctomycetes bacterium]|nr:hypothetical protein [Planctomycetota bacterium]
MRFTGIALAAVLVLAAFSEAFAVDPEGIEVTSYLPEFKTDDAVGRIEEGLAPARQLDSALKESTEKIWQLVEDYRKSPSPELEGKIYNAVAESGKLIVEHISSIESQRDRLRDELRALTFNVEGVMKNIETYTEGLDGRVKDVVEEAGALKDELKAMARALAQNPDDKEKRREFKAKILEFKRLQMKLAILQRNREMYAKLAEQIGTVSGFFQAFDTRLDSVLESLAIQKKLIAMNLTVLRDKAKVVAWLRGEAGGRDGAAGLVRQLAGLSASINGFEKVMDVMMNLGSDFDDFAELVPELTDPSVSSAAAVSEEDLDRLIEKFASE